MALNYYRCGCNEEANEKTARVFRVSHCDSFSFVNAHSCAAFYAAYTRAFATAGTVDRDTIAKHFHGGLAFCDASRGISMARESVGHRGEEPGF